MGDPVRHAAALVERERVDAVVRAVGDHERAPIGTERDLRRVAAGRECPHTVGKPDQPTVLGDLEAGEIRLAADVEDIRESAVHRDAGRDRAARSRPIDEGHLPVLGCEDGDVVTPCIRNDDPAVAQDERAL